MQYLVSATRNKFNSRRQVKLWAHIFLVWTRNETQTWLVKIRLLIGHQSTGNQSGTSVSSSLGFASFDSKMNKIKREPRLRLRDARLSPAACGTAVRQNTAIDERLLAVSDPNGPPRSRAGRSVLSVKKKTSPFAPLFFPRISLWRPRFSYLGKRWNEGKKECCCCCCCCCCSSCCCFWCWSLLDVTADDEDEPACNDSHFRAPPPPFSLAPHLPARQVQRTHLLLVNKGRIATPTPGR